MTVQHPRKGRKLAQVHVGARQIFLRDGYAGASVDDIARAARVSKATLYSYFPEKSVMFREVMLHELEEVARQSPIQIDSAMPAQAALPEMARQIAQWQYSDLPLCLLRVNIAEANRFPDIARTYQKVLDDILYDVIRQHLDRWVTQEELVIQNSLLAAHQLVSLTGATLQERLLVTAMPPEAHAAHIRDVSAEAARIFLASFQPVDGRQRHAAKAF
ncbi:TetR/AcrR family transcriptional regulator [Paracoccus seriniphilus]|uniref:TetR/AcrR family transcriptional regulator n=1 Tax=Paracoccus seriniphilus TaxID=184748 RepID=UPI0035640743